MISQLGIILNVGFLSGKLAVLLITFSGVNYLTRVIVDSVVNIFYFSQLLVILPREWLSD